MVANFKKDLILTLSLISLVVLGGLGKIDTAYISFVSIITLVVNLYLLRSEQKTFIAPPGLKIFILFLLLLVLSLTWSFDPVNSLKYSALFSSGALFWIFSFNFSNKLRAILPSILVLCGGIFLLLSIFSLFSKSLHIVPLSLFALTSGNLNHNHIGDYAVLVVVLALFKFLDAKKDFLWLVIGLIAMATAALSFSRSAYFSLIVGVYYLITKAIGDKKTKKLILVFFIIFTSIFIVLVGTKKSIINSRQFYPQAVSGIVSNPVGVGMGNFWFISNNPKYQLFAFKGTAAYVENAILEILVGTGILGLIFLVWFGKVIYEAIKKSDDTLYIALFLTLTFNFIFDYTYFIPTMLWLWFVLLGLSQSKSK